jgi:thioesterase DpgC
VCDHVIAEKGAYMTLPARKEGIIPGLANMRLPRFVGDRIARQAILGERRLECDSPEGRLICDQVVDASAIEQTLEHTVLHLTGSGVVSAQGNRRMIRAAVEPFDLFRQYMAAYTREQAFCHVSPALVGNLEKYWNAASRKAR